MQTPSKRDHVPSMQVPRQRRVLPIWNHGEFMSIFVDDDGSCRDQHILCYGKHHRYQDEEGRLIAMMCPERLSWDQKSSIVEDTPPGSWNVKVAGRKIDKIAQDAEKRRKAIEEERSAYKGRQ